MLGLNGYGNGSSFQIASFDNANLRGTTILVQRVSHSGSEPQQCRFFRRRPPLDRCGVAGVVHVPSRDAAQVFRRNSLSGWVRRRKTPAGKRLELGEAERGNGPKVEREPPTANVPNADDTDNIAAAKQGPVLLGRVIDQIMNSTPIPDVEVVSMAEWLRGFVARRRRPMQKGEYRFDPLKNRRSDVSRTRVAPITTQACNLTTPSMCQPTANET